LFTTRYILTPRWIEKTEITFPSQPNPLPVAVEIQQDENNHTAAKTILSLGSWRIDDQTKIEKLLELFQERNSQIKINFTPTNTLDYQNILAQQLRQNEAPDLFYVFPYSAAQNLITNDYLKPITNIDNLAEIFPPEALEPWQGEDGKIYALPVMGVSHGIYYNHDIFQELGLEIPTTWQELLSTATVLKNAGYIPLANGSKVELRLLENVFMNLAPNFIGGREGRLKYLSGKRCFNDANSVAAFQALADLRPFLPVNHENLTKPGSKQLFVTGKAAMWMAGSWNISSLETSPTEFTWSVFAVPPPQGKAPQVTFQPDFAIGINPKSLHQQEAEQFIQWLSKKEIASLWANELPGFFPLHKQVSNLKNIHAQTFLKLNQNRGTDARWAAVKLGDGLPNGYGLMETAVAGVVKGEMTPQQAADYLQSGLSQWFEPAQKCDSNN
jgi:raffinose/stachyose/melibiose transport system substrate-binding protein